MGDHSSNAVVKNNVNPRSGVTTAGQMYAPGRVFLIIFKKYMLVSVSVSTTVFGTVFTVYQIIYLA